MYATRSAMAFVIGVIAASPALAQTTSAPPAGSKQTIPEKQGAPVQSGRSESLSNKLSNSNGVIKPSGDVDPGMKVPTPNSETHPMPVIPPSATGGNNAK